MGRAAARSQTYTRPQIMASARPMASDTMWYRFEPKMRSFTSPRGAKLLKRLCRDESSRKLRVSCTSAARTGGTGRPLKVKPPSSQA